MEKINRLQEATGNDDVKFSADDISGDFDAEAYDERMKVVYFNRRVGGKFPILGYDWKDAFSILPKGKVVWKWMNECF